MTQYVEYEKNYERKTTLGITFDTTCSQEVKLNNYKHFTDSVNYFSYYKSLFVFFLGVKILPLSQVFSRSGLAGDLL